MSFMRLKHNYGEAKTFSAPSRVLGGGNVKIRWKLNSFRNKMRLNSEISSLPTRGEMLRLLFIADELTESLSESRGEKGLEKLVCP